MLAHAMDRRHYAGTLHLPLGIAHDRRHAANTEDHDWRTFLLTSFVTGLIVVGFLLWMHRENPGTFSQGLHTAAASYGWEGFHRVPGR